MKQALLQLLSVVISLRLAGEELSSIDPASQQRREVVICNFGIVLREGGLTGAVIQDRMDEFYQDIQPALPMNYTGLAGILGLHRVFVQSPLRKEDTLPPAIFVQAPQMPPQAIHSYSMHLTRDDSVWLLLLKPASGYSPKGDLVPHDRHTDAEIIAKLKALRPDELVKELGLGKILNRQTWFETTRPFAGARIDMSPTLALPAPKITDPTVLSRMERDRQWRRDKKPWTQLYPLFPPGFVADIRQLLGDDVRQLIFAARRQREAAGISLAEDAAVQAWSKRLATREGVDVLHAMVEAVNPEETTWEFMAGNAEFYARQYLAKYKRLQTSIKQQRALDKRDRQLDAASAGTGAPSFPLDYLPRKERTLALSNLEAEEQRMRGGLMSLWVNYPKDKPRPEAIKALDGVFE